MTALYRTEAERERAALYRRLLLRLENGEGADRGLGADIVDTVGEIPAVAGDPTGCVDCALYLCLKLNFSRLDALLSAVRSLRERAREGWKPVENITEADVARAITTAIVRTLIARAEAAPV